MNTLHHRDGFFESEPCSLVLPVLDGTDWPPVVDGVVFVGLVAVLYLAIGTPWRRSILPAAATAVWLVAAAWVLLFSEWSSLWAVVGLAAAAGVLSAAVGAVHRLAAHLAAKVASKPSPGGSTPAGPDEA